MRSSTQKSSRFSCRRCGSFRIRSSKSRRFLPAATRNKLHAVALRGNISLGDSAMQTAKGGWLEVICSGERAATPPTVWTKLEILFRIGGSLQDDAVKHAIALSAQ